MTCSALRSMAIPTSSVFFSPMAGRVTRCAKTTASYSKIKNGCRSTSESRADNEGANQRRVGCYLLGDELGWGSAPGHRSCRISGQGRTAGMCFHEGGKDLPEHYCPPGIQSNPG